MASLDFLNDCDADMSYTMFVPGVNVPASSAANLLSLYNSGEPTDLKEETFAANLINWWRMGDPSGPGSYPTIADAQGSLNLAMTNMTSANINTNVPT